MNEIAHKVLTDKYTEPHLSFAQIGARYGLSKDSAQKLAKRLGSLSSPYDAAPAPAELVIKGDVVIIGDIHANFIHWPVIHKAIELGYRYGIKQVILAGDVFNLNSLSKYPKMWHSPPFEAEKLAARVMFAKLQAQFKKFWWIRGNHDYRISVATYGNLQMDELADMMVGDLKGRKDLVTSPLDRCYVETKESGRWMIVHQDMYSRNKLIAAERLSSKYECHVVTHHQHHVGVGVSKNGKYVIADNGCACTDEYYKTCTTNDMPEWNPGCALIHKGTYLQYAFNQPFGIK